MHKLGTERQACLGSGPRSRFCIASPCKIQGPLTHVVNFAYHARCTGLRRMRYALQPAELGVACCMFRLGSWKLT